MSFPVVLSLVLVGIGLIVLLTSWLKHNTLLLRVYATTTLVMGLTAFLVILPCAQFLTW